MDTTKPIYRLFGYSLIYPQDIADSSLPEENHIQLSAQTILTLRAYQNEGNATIRDMSITPIFFSRHSGAVEKTMMQMYGTDHEMTFKRFAEDLYYNFFREQKKTEVWIFASAPLLREIANGIGKNATIYWYGVDSMRPDGDIPVRFSPEGTLLNVFHGDDLCDTQHHHAPAIFSEEFMVGGVKLSV